ncbi:MarR family winged helix-turn-helix transcriptional regulator [Thermobifida cellulosilytica]|uniref:MarR family winged helix-turn-helix transcriptional regulator n=1 Tax=Thermobifida cellulosilytica TaxID=144786 RepID=UPI000A037E8C|nr:MarR family transcriptional regulator [Thermobifida cellulosilytica]
MTSSEERLREARELAELLVRVAEESKAVFARTAGEIGLPAHLARAVASLDGPMPMRELADRLACDRSNITGIADQLEQRGLAERTPGRDRRVKLLQLTPAGRRLRADIADRVSNSALVLQRLDDAQRAQLRPLLQALLGEQRT